MLTYTRAFFVWTNGAGQSWPTDWPLEMKFYQHRPEINMTNYVSDNNGLDSDNFIYCTTDLTPSIVVDTLKSPWNDDDLYTQLRYSDDFIVKYRINVDQGYPNDDICKVSAKVKYFHDTNSNGVYDDTEELLYKTVPISPISGDPNTYTVDGDYLIIDKTDYDYQFSNVGHDPQYYVTFEFEIDYYDDIEEQYTGWLPWIRHAGKINLCPIIYYCDNGTVNIDNVGVSCEKYNDLLDGDFDTNIQSAINTYDDDYVIGFSGRDEPFVPQFNSHDYVNDYLETNASESVFSPYAQVIFIIPCITIILITL